MSATGQPWLHDLVTALRAPTVVLSERSGQIRPGGAQGVLHADARVLSAAELSIGGAEPVPVSSGLLDAGRALFIGIARGLGDPGPDPTVRVERERTVRPGHIRERITVTSTAALAVSTELTLRLSADLAGLGEIKSGQASAAAGVPMMVPNGAAHPAAAPGPDPGDEAGVPAPLASPALLSWGPGALRARLAAPGAAVTLLPGTGAELRWPVDLAPRAERQFGWELAVTDPDAVVAAAPSAGPDDRDEAGPAWPAVQARADDPRLPRLLRQALPDAAALRMATASRPGDTFLAGGAPWFLTLFGRDSIWSARLLLPFGWELAAGTLRTLAALQGTRVDPQTGEAPGKIPHELRTAGRQGLAGLPALYYGTIDATPLWVCLLHDAWRAGMPEGQVRALLPSLTAALACLRDYGDADGDGFLEYIDESGRGLANQGWKDSGDAIRFAGGSIASPPVALCEVQGYAYEAATRGADLLDALGEPGAGQWRDWAGQLAARFRQAFWVNDGAGRYPALALDAAKRPVDSLTSNIGHLLGTGLLTPAEEDEVVARLSAPDMSSGWGLRTMSAANGGYSPLSYHCGSVWSHDTAIVIRGMARGGHAAAAVLADGLLDAAAEFGWRLPELFAGDGRPRVPWPSAYPASCRPQAWAAAAAGALVQALLGLEVDVPAGRVRVSPPPARPGGAGRRLLVDGLVAGQELFSAGIDADGAGYVTGLSPALVSA
jgi:glycogen debranching enzyme